MTRIKRPAAALGATVLLAFSLTACGGAPTDASEEDFCEAVSDTALFEDLDADSSAEDIVDALKEQADQIEEVGTPEDIPDDAREGFEISLEQINDLDADDIEDPSDLSGLETDLSEEDQEKVDAYTEYENETCGGGDLEIPDPEGS